MISSFTEEKRKMANTHENAVSLEISKMQGKATMRCHCPPTPSDFLKVKRLQMPSIVLKCKPRE